MKCFFCGNPLPRGGGKIFVTRIGEIIPLCSSKCEKNLKLGRKPHRVKWTEKYKSAHEKKEEKIKKAKPAGEITKENKEKLSKKERLEKKKKKQPEGDKAKESVKDKEREE